MPGTDSTSLTDTGDKDTVDMGPGDKDVVDTGPGDRGPIVVAVDFSPDSEAALAWASGYASSVGAPLLILHVVHDPAHAPGYYREVEADWVEPMTAVAERMMSEFLARMRHAHAECRPVQEAETALVSGLPAGRIVEVAERKGARLIVVGSLGRTGLTHIMLGSVAERVVRTARAPVVVVKTGPSP